MVMIRRREHAAADSPAARPYALEAPAVAPPPLPGEVMVRSTTEELIDAISADMVIHAENCVRQFGDFHLALSGGTTPQPLYERLMYDPDCRRLPWRRTHLWLVDERCVEFSDPLSNFQRIRETIGDHADIPREQLHPISAMSDAADVEYERQLKETLAWREKGQDRLDYVLLGMGADGHTASLFPFNEAVREEMRFVMRIDEAAAAPRERITMTFPLINAARFIAVMVTGAGKAETLHRVATGDESIEALPIKGVRPLNGELKWYLDAPACGETVGPQE